MAQGDITIKASNGVLNVPTISRQTEAGETDINFGEPVKLKAAGSNFAIPLATAEPVIGTTTALFGIAQSDSTHTATADGVVEVYVPQPGITYLCDATTIANIDTQAKYDALVGNRVAFDLTGAIFTVDENQADGATLALYIENIDINVYPGKVAFSMRIDATVLSA